MLDLVELGVAELLVLDKQPQGAICELIPIGQPASFDAPAPTNGTSLRSCAASRSVPGTSGIGGISGSHRHELDAAAIRMGDVLLYVYAKADAQRGREGRP